jgi:hypothetical protein
MGQIINAYNILVRKPDGMKTLGDVTVNERTI